MKKKIIVLSLILIVVVIIICIINHYLPVWVSILSLISVIVGSVIGWFCKSLYDQYIKETPDEYYKSEEEI